MALGKHFISISFTLFIASLFLPSSPSFNVFAEPAILDFNDNDLLEFPLNLEFLEAEFFLYGALGSGLDAIDPKLAQGGPLPSGAKLAHLDPLTKDIILQFGYQEVGHLRAILSKVKGFPRPLLNLSSEAFATIMDNAFGKPLNPPFDPYANSINYLLASYVIPYVGLTGYVGAAHLLQNETSKELVAGLLGVESGQDAVIRTLLYQHKDEVVNPYNVSVAEFTNRISMLRDKLGKMGMKDEGLVVANSVGAEGKISGNILAGDNTSVAYPRQPQEVLRIVYGTGDERVPGGFHPKGGDGRIAKSLLTNRA
ncbi:desiccation-related protein PCC13-62-like [Neltuma alba]|uniref:desiccation-related protein PCC13-62-like n=1 Tax=Neltuma alba TaxID=207710 RepID=UPI0010A3519B|nr:desiccation-related protein PCC13-62-like [Prosopis alba]